MATLDKDSFTPVKGGRQRKNRKADGSPLLHFHHGLAQLASQHSSPSKAFHLHENHPNYSQQCRSQI